MKAYAIISLKTGKVTKEWEAKGLGSQLNVFLNKKDALDIFKAVYSKETHVVMAVQMVYFEL